MKREQQSTSSLTAGCSFFALFLCFLLLSISAPTVFADEEKQEPQKRELYQWKDDRGTVHITDDAGKIPVKYRSKAEKIESVESAEPALPAQERGRSGGAAPQTPIDEGEDDLQRILWLERLKEWRDRLADAEKRLQDLEQKREEALRRWGGSAASGRLEGGVEADQIEQEMKKVQQEIDEARNQIEVVIPGEARKAGVPPGWLRE